MFSQCYLRIVKKTFLLLTEPTGEILQTTLPSYFKTVHCKNVSFV